MQCFQILFDLAILTAGILKAYCHQFISMLYMSWHLQYPLVQMLSVDLLTWTYIFVCLLVPILSINDTTFSIFYIYFDRYFQYISDFLTPILSVLLTWYITCTGTLNVLYTYSYRCSRYTWYLSSTILSLNKKLTC